MKWEFDILYALQKIHQPVMVFAPGTIQKLRGNAGHVMGPVRADSSAGS